jgi:hypothetical protein
MSDSVVAIAQLVESQIVILVVVGSSPISHPTQINKSPSATAWGLFFGYHQHPIPSGLAWLWSSVQWLQPIRRKVVLAKHLERHVAAAFKGLLLSQRHRRECPIVVGLGFCPWQRDQLTTG